MITEEQTQHDTHSPAPFFSTPERLAQLQQAAASWIGTKFFPHGRVKRAGVDCVHLCAEIYRECGVFPSYAFPRYSIDGGHHAGSSLVIQWLEKHPSFEKVEISAARAGDIHCFKIGKSEWHVGIQLTDHTFIHCWRKQGVLIELIQDPTYTKRLTSVYRPLKTEH